jgi:diaminopimelate epimerase
MEGRMRRVRFTKMHGAGNDFIVADNRRGDFPADAASIAGLCRRRFSVGADGLLLLEPAPDADFAMRYFNADGGEAEMCGNGARCIARFAWRIGAAGRRMAFRSRSGLHRAEIVGDCVRVSLSPPADIRSGLRLGVGGATVEVLHVNTGVPHVVTFVRDLEAVDVAGLGRALRRHQDLRPAGANVDFVRLDGPGRISVRTYERGVEGETLACGTGVTASALAAHLVEGMEPPVKVLTAGGAELGVSWRRKGDGFEDVVLEGDAVLVFDGSLPMEGGGGR